MSSTPGLTRRFRGICSRVRFSCALRQAPEPDYGSSSGFSLYMASCNDQSFGASRTNILLGNVLAREIRALSDI